jgi:hypothetical protein
MIFFALNMIHCQLNMGDMAHNAKLNGVASWRAFWNKKRDSLLSQIAAFCYVHLLAK